MAKFKFILSMDRGDAARLPWVHVKARLRKLFNEKLGGLKPIVSDILPKEDPTEDYEVEVESKE